MKTFNTFIVTLSRSFKLFGYNYFLSLSLGFRKKYPGISMNLTTRHSVGSFANLQQQFINLPTLIDQLSPFEDIFLDAERASLPNSNSIAEATKEEPFGFSGNNQIVLSFEELALNENTNCFLRHSRSYCSGKYLFNKFLFKTPHFFLSFLSNNPSFFRLQLKSRKKSISPFVI